MKTKQLALLNEAIASCVKCPSLVTERLLTVPGEGNPNTKLVIVGEAPGEYESKTGRPFVGKAGELLTNTLAAMGIAREDVFIANCLKCRPPNNRTPSQEECQNCWPFLQLQLKIINPRVILCLGAVAAKNVLKMELSMSALRGKIFEYKDDPVDAKVICSWHPSYLLRKPEAKQGAWADMEYMLKQLGLCY
jgi:DNA polymerase